MAPKKKIEQKPHEYKRDMRSYFALPKQQASRASTTNAQSASAPSRDQNNEDNSDDLVIVASDVEEEIFDTVAVSISTTDRPTRTIRCSPDGDRKRKANALKIGMYFLLLLFYITLSYTNSNFISCWLNFYLFRGRGRGGWSKQTSGRTR